MQNFLGGIPLNTLLEARALGTCVSAFDAKIIILSPYFPSKRGWILGEGEALSNGSDKKERTKWGEHVEVGGGGVGRDTKAISGF